MKEEEVYSSLTPYKLILLTLRSKIKKAKSMFFPRLKTVKASRVCLHLGARGCSGDASGDAGGRR